MHNLFRSSILDLINVCLKGQLISQIREQMLVPDLYVLTVESAAYKKRLKREKKGHSPQPKIDFPYYEISDICSLICVSFPPVCAI